MYANLGKSQLLQLLFEKDCYILALQQQLDSCKTELQFAKQLQHHSRIQNFTDQDDQLNSSKENAISPSRVKQFQSWSNQTKIKSTPLTSSNVHNSFKQSQRVRQKIISESIDILNFTTEEFGECPSIKEPKLFEEFMMFGLQTSDIQQRNISPRLLFQYNSRFDKKDQQQAAIINFILPQGAQPQIIKLNSKQSELYSIIYNTFIIDNNPNCYVVTFKMQEAQQQIYYVCVKFQEFTAIDQQNAQIHQRVICISTVIPQFSFFFQLLLTFLNELKTNRIVSINQKSNIHHIDSKMTDQQIQLYSIKCLTQLSLQKLPIEQTQGIKIVNHTLELHKYHDKMELEWCINSVFARFSPKQILQIFLCLLTEVSIVFCCEHYNILTCVVIICQKYLLKPFNWIHPFVSILPIEHYQILDSPVPIIVGIDQKEVFELSKQHPNMLFIDINHKQAQFYNQDSIPLVSADLMSYLSNKIASKLAECQQTQSNLFSVFEEFLQDKILSHLPQKPRYNMLSFQQSRKNLLDYESIAKQTLDNITRRCNQDKYLWNKFFKTQIFIQFIDSYYI